MYAELHCHSHYSMLDGASAPLALVDRALRQGYTHLALTDHGGLYGAVRFHNAARARGLVPIIGLEVELEMRNVPEGVGPTRAAAGEGGDHLTLLARDDRGYRSLCRLVSRAQLRGEKRHPRFLPEDLAAHAEGLVALTGCRGGEVARRVLEGDLRAARAAAARLAAPYGPDGFWIELQDHLLPDSRSLCRELAALADGLGLGVVATNNVHYAERDGHRLHDVLTCIRHNTTLDAAAEGRGGGGASSGRRGGGDVGARARPRRGEDGGPGGGYGDPPLLRANSEYYLKGPDEMAELFRWRPDAVANAGRIAALCGHDRPLSSVIPPHRHPRFPLPPGHTARTYLYALCLRGLRERYGVMSRGIPRGAVTTHHSSLITPYSSQLRHELGVIGKLGLENFFLVVWDIVAEAGRRGIPIQGRGSAADSLVAYVLGITRVDPLKHDLLFERFLNEERQGMPDIDLDVSTDHREELIRYVYERYGVEHVAMAATVITYRARSAVRDVGKALGFPPEVLDAAAKRLDFHGDVEQLRREASRHIPVATSYPTHPTSERNSPGAESDVPVDSRGRPGGVSLRHAEGEETPGGGPGDLEEGGHIGPPLLGASGSARPEGRPWEQLLELCAEIEGHPRHLGIHVGGMIVTEGPIDDLVPIERAAMPGRVVTQYDKDDLEDLGLIKVDLLGLRTLSLVHAALGMIREETGEAPDLDSLPTDDPGVYDMLCRGDSLGVFQVESRAQMATLPKMRPRRLDDLIAEVAIIRPGPIQGGMVHPFLRRRQGLEPVTYLHPLLEPILGETLGVCIYQEQVIRIASDVAGFGLAEADLFRRAMGSHRSRDAMRAIQRRFVEGCLGNGLTEPQAEELFRQIEGFSVYGFCKSHAAAFARTTYETAWLKLHHPAPFYAALLNAQPMGFYSPEVVLGDARRRGVRILPVDANRSRSRCTVEGIGERDAGAGDGASPLRGRQAVRLGFRYVRDLGAASLARLDAERERGPYGAFREFCLRTGLDRDAIESLIFAGAFDTSDEGTERGRGPSPHHSSLPTHRSRRRLLWELGRIVPERGPSAGGRGGYGDPPLRLPYVWEEPELRAMSAYERVAEEYLTMGLSPAHHLVEFYRTGLDRLGALSAQEIEDLPGGPVRVAGLVVCRQAPPTAKGHVFLTLEDETGLVNIVLRPSVFARDREAIRAARGGQLGPPNGQGAPWDASLGGVAAGEYAGSPLLVVDGMLQVESGVRNVLASGLRAFGGRPSASPPGSSRGRGPQNAARA